MSRASSINHAFHSWINQRQERRRQDGMPHESSLYEWKNMLLELTRLPAWLQAARTHTLPAVHQQCSHVAPEAIENNVLRCALGLDVSQCEILESLYASLSKHAEADQAFDALLREKWPDREPYEGITEADGDTIGAQVCTWHIFTARFIGLDGKHPQFLLDTSEGYVQDKGDRRYWQRVYAHLVGNDPDEEADNGDVA